MGLSAFNAMRARMKAEAKALEGSGANAVVKPAEVSKPVAESANSSEAAVENSVKKTDAEKLKKKKE